MTASLAKKVQKSRPVNSLLRRSPAKNGNNWRRQNVYARPLNRLLLSGRISLQNCKTAPAVITTYLSPVSVGFLLTNVRFAQRLTSVEASILLLGEGVR